MIFEKVFCGTPKQVQDDYKTQKKGKRVYGSLEFQRMYTLFDKMGV